MKHNIKIGGEFEIDPNQLKGIQNYNSENSPIQFSSGRSALTAVLLHIFDSANPIIFVPYYICQSVVDACQNANFEIRFYELGNDFKFPITEVENIPNHACLLSVNYFGFIDDNSLIIEIKKQRPDITVIADHVQSYWTCSNSVADFSFTSLRKHFAIPDGAIIYRKGEVWYAEGNFPENHFYDFKLMGSILKFHNVDDDIYLRYFEKGERILYEEIYPTKASEISKWLFKVMNLRKIKEARISNFKQVYEFGKIKGLNFVFPFNPNIVPLCIPIKVDNRNLIRKALFSRNIYLPIHWPLSSFNVNSNIAKQFDEIELSLIIDQRYGERDLQYQLKSINQV